LDFISPHFTLEPMKVIFHCSSDAISNQQYKIRGSEKSLLDECDNRGMQRLEGHREKYVNWTITTYMIKDCNNL
jgi:hypothetical protein